MFFGLQRVVRGNRTDPSLEPPSPWPSQEGPSAPSLEKYLANKFYLKRGGLTVQMNLFAEQK